MSQANLEIVKQGNDALRRGDWDAAEAWGSDLRKRAETARQS